ncbi:MAG: TIGR03032 family protein [Cyclobacteriaceae bacterium]
MTEKKKTLTLPKKNFFYYSASLPAILEKTKSSIVFSTYQAGKLIFISSKDGEILIKYAKNFARPMGIAFDPKTSRLAVATKNQINVFGNSSALAQSFPEKPNHYDAMFMPQCRYYTGRVDTHEIAFGEEGLWTVNTQFSALTLMTDSQHFEVKWKPPFIGELRPFDKCHLNGMAMKDGKPKYVSMFGEMDQPTEWRKSEKNHGLIMDVDTGEVLVRNLTMPHTPTLYEEKIYFLQSGTGQIMYYDLKTKQTVEVALLKSFLRGLEVIGDFLFVGASELREQSTSFGKLPISDQETFCGIYVYNRHTGQQVAGLSYTDLVKEIFSVKVLPGLQVAGILTEKDELYDKCITAGNGLNFWLKKSDQKEQEA